MREAIFAHFGIIIGQRHHEIGDETLLGFCGQFIEFRDGFSARRLVAVEELLGQLGDFEARQGQRSRQNEHVVPGKPAMNRRYLRRISNILASYRLE